MFDASSNKETRSFLVLDDGTFGISSVNAKVLCNRANGVEKAVKEKAADTEETGSEYGNDEMEAMGGYYDEDEYWEASPNTEVFEGE